MSRIVEKLEMEKKSDTSIEQEKMEEDPDRFHLGGFPNLENIDRAENVVIQGSRDTDIVAPTAIIQVLFSTLWNLPRTTAGKDTKGESAWK